MPPVLKFGLKNGVSSSVSARDDAPEYCERAVNFFRRQDGLVKRQGSRPVLNFFHNEQAATLAWTEEDDLTSTSLPVFGATATAPVSTGKRWSVLWIKYTTPFSKVKLDLDIAFTSALQPDVRPEIRAWNDSAQELLSALAQDCSVPAYDSTANAWSVGIGFASAKTGSGTLTQSVSFALWPYETWITTGGIGIMALVWDKTVNIPDPGTLAKNAYVQPCEAEASGSISFRPAMRCVCLTPWKDAAGAPHLFAAFVYRGPAATDKPYLVFWCDGQKLTQVGAVSADEDADVQVEAFYHPGPNRLIGHIVNGPWFYLSDGGGDGSVYLLEAFDESGTADAKANPFASDIGGLRPAMPRAQTIALHDNRVFAAVGESLQWSAPDAYPDTWPNRNERFLADGGGPITDLCSIGSALVVAKRNNVYVVTPNGNPQGYDAAPIAAGVGAIGKITPCGSFVLITADDGLYVFDGSSLRKISAALDRAFFEQRYGALDRSIGVFSTPWNQWRLFYPSTSYDACDRALYVDLEGWTSNSQGDPESQMGVWPQGPYGLQDSSDPAFDPGFLVTAACEDESTGRRRILIGTALGVILEMDAGTKDHGIHVKSEAVQGQVNMDSQGGLLMSRMRVAMSVSDDRSIEFGVIPDGWEAQEQSCSVSLSHLPGYTVNGDFAADFTVWDAQGFTTFLLPATVFPDYAVRLQTMQVTVRDEGEGDLAVHSFMVDVAPGSRRR